MRAWLAAVLFLPLLVWGQPAPREADYRKLMNGYRDTFKILGRSRVCGYNFDAEPFYREVVRRHGEPSEAMTLARLAFTAGAENTLLSREIDPTPAAPIPCDVLQYLRDMRLPELPASLAP